MFRSLPIPSSGQHLVVKGTVSAHCTVWDPVCLQNVRKNNYKSIIIIIFSLQLSFHSVAVVLRLVTNKNKYT
jgi:hypothetical protein